ncbi:hypothetical protein IAT40_002030 [Kwoniella sp. CBS 6097]
MSSTVLLTLTHESSFSLSQLTKPLPSSLSISSIALPSRFPSTSTPTLTLAPSGAIFVHSTSGHVVWEYDSKGRRISEMSFPGDRTSRVLSLGRKAGKDRVLVGLRGNEALKVMRKHEGKWACIDTLQGPMGKLSALVTNRSSTLIAAGSTDGELVIFDLERGPRVVVPLSDRVTGPISHLAFSPSTPNTLVLSDSTTLLRLTIPSDPISPIDIRPLCSFSSDHNTKIVDVVFSPTTENQGVKKGDLCAVSSESGEVALIGLDDVESTAQMISYGRSDLAGLVFLDEVTLAARTKNGSLLTKDVRAISEPPEEITCSEPILSVQILAPTSRSARPSTLAPSSTSSRRSVLGENDHKTNMPTPPSAPKLNTGIKSVQVERGKKETARPSSVSAGIQKVSVDPRPARLAQEEKKVEKRAVSAPVVSIAPAIKHLEPTAIESSKVDRPPRVSGSRSISGPTASGSGISTQSASHKDSVASSSKHRVHIAPLPSHAHTSRCTTSISVIEEVDEDPHSAQPSPQMEVYKQSGDLGRNPADCVDEYVGQKERSVHLDWVLTQPRPHAVNDAEVGPGSGMSDRERMEEMWREMMNLRLDMLRMKREHKHDLNKAVREIRDEMREDKALIENQRREIDRLRRGY